MKYFPSNPEILLTEGTGVISLISAFRTVLFGEALSLVLEVSLHVNRTSDLLFMIEEETN